MRIVEWEKGFAFREEKIVGKSKTFITYGKVRTTIWVLVQRQDEIMT